MLNTTVSYRGFQINIIITTENEEGVDCENQVFVEICSQSEQIVIWSWNPGYYYLGQRQRWITEALDKAIDYLEANCVTEKLNAPPKYEEGCDGLPF